MVELRAEWRPVTCSAIQSGISQLSSSSSSATPTGVGPPAFGAFAHRDDDFRGSRCMASGTPAAAAAAAFPFAPPAPITYSSPERMPSSDESPPAAATAFAFSFALREPPRLDAFGGGGGSLSSVTSMSSSDDSAPAAAAGRGRRRGWRRRRGRRRRWPRSA